VCVGVCVVSMGGTGWCSIRLSVRDRGPWSEEMGKEQADNRAPSLRLRQPTISEYPVDLQVYSPL
jgi:hypothetical protein